MSLRLRDPYDLMYGNSVKEEEKEEAVADQETGGGFIKKKRRPANLCIECPVCGGPAPDHVHFGGQCCYSCRAFFRRSSARSVSSFRCRSGRNDCIITSGIKSCIPCRLTKCLEVGMDPNLVRGKKPKGEKYEFEDEAEEENEELIPVDTQDTIGHRNLLKYRAEILKYQGMCLQYQASLLEKKATQLSSPGPLRSYQTSPRLSTDQRDQAVFERREQFALEDSKSFAYPGAEDIEAPLDLTMKSPAAGPHLHTQSAHMPRIFFSRLSASNLKF